jgi:hypothetical protein
MKWYAPHAFQVLFSPEHGYFVWTPLAVLAVVGLLLAIPPKGGNYTIDEVPPKGGSYTIDEVPPKGGSYNVGVASAFRRNLSGGVDSAFRRNNIAWLLLLMAALQVYISGSVDSWTVAGGFGQRRFVALTTVLVIGLAGLHATISGGVPARQGRWVMRAVTILAVYWNIALTAEFATGLMDRQRLEPAKNAYAAFVTLPRLAPELAYRYVFDRQSFYRANPVPR